MALPILPLLGVGISALGSIFQGAQQRAQARRNERNNIRPNYTISPEILQNQAIARQNASVGLPDQVYNNQLNLIQQNMATGLRNLGQRATNPVNINSLVSTSNQAVGNLNAMDAQARQQNLNQLYNQNANVASERRQQFNVNQLQPYQQNVQNIISQRRAGTQNIFGGLGILAQASMLGVFNNQHNNYTMGANRVDTLTPNLGGIGLNGIYNQ